MKLYKKVKKNRVLQFFMDFGMRHPIAAISPLMGERNNLSVKKRILTRFVKQSRRIHWVGQWCDFRACSNPRLPKPPPAVLLSGAEIPAPAPAPKKNYAHNPTAPKVRLPDHRFRLLQWHKQGKRSRLDRALGSSRASYAIVGHTR
jgi:hypothetical protein